ncbi:MAG: hypothetical protein ACTSX7_01965 [Alphaproteobacteria bacterium]
MMQTAPSSISASSLFKALLAIIVLVVLIDQLGGLFLRNIYLKSTNSPIGRIAQAAPANLVLGSSTAKHAIDPAAFLPATYNAAENGQSLFHAVAMLRSLPPNTGLQRVIIGLDPDDIVSGYKSNNVSRLWRLAPLAYKDKVLRGWLGQTDTLVDIKFLSGLFPYRRIAPSVVDQWLRPRTTGNGYDALEGEMAGELSLRLSSEPMVIAPESADLLAALAAAAKRLDLQIVTVATPLAGYLREQDPLFAPALQAMRGALAGTDHCDLTTYTAPWLENFIRQRQNFWDGPHLNRQGAIAYSTALAEVVETQCPITGETS